MLPYASLNGTKGNSSAAQLSLILFLSSLNAVAITPFSAVVNDIIVSVVNTSVSGSTTNEVQKNHNFDILLNLSISSFMVGITLFNGMCLFSIGIQRSPPFLKVGLLMCCGKSEVLVTSWIGSTSESTFVSWMLP